MQGSSAAAANPGKEDAFTAPGKREHHWVRGVDRAIMSE
jgi:hypothetical protein